MSVSVVHTPQVMGAPPAFRRGKSSKKKTVCQCGISRATRKDRDVYYDEATGNQICSHPATWRARDGSGFVSFRFLFVRFVAGIGYPLFQGCQQVAGRAPSYPEDVDLNVRCLIVMHIKGDCQVGLSVSRI